MVEIAAFTYGLVASIVLSRLGRDRRAARPSGPVAVMTAWALFGFSAALAGLIAGWLLAGLAFL
jgi:lipid-binding SYLF domain-containing protein